MDKHTQKPKQTYVGFGFTYEADEHVAVCVYVSVFEVVGDQLLISMHCSKVIGQHDQGRESPQGCHQPTLYTTSMKPMKRMKLNRGFVSVKPVKGSVSVS
jgi:hypothetical protein